MSFCSMATTEYKNDYTRLLGHRNALTTIAALVAKGKCRIIENEKTVELTWSDIELMIKWYENEYTMFVNKYGIESSRLTLHPPGGARVTL